jgi:hypothetical protein
MRNLLGWLLVIAFCGGAAIASNSGKRVPFTLHISTDKPTVSAGSEVWIKVEITNTSDHWENFPAGAVTYFGKGGTAEVDANFTYEVRDGSGRLAPAAVPSRSIADARADHGGIGPGETLTRDLRISDERDLSRPGQYTVKLSRKIPGQKGIVESNTVTITVRP